MIYQMSPDELSILNKRFTIALAVKNNSEIKIKIIKETRNSLMFYIAFMQCHDVQKANSAENCIDESRLIWEVIESGYDLDEVKLEIELEIKKYKRDLITANTDIVEEYSISLDEV